MKESKPDPLLEFRLLGEVPRALRRRADARRNDQDLFDRLESLRESDRRILEELPASDVSENVSRRLREESFDARADRTLHARILRWTLGPALAAGALLLVFAPFRSIEEPAPARTASENAATHEPRQSDPAGSEKGSPPAPTAKSPRSREAIPTDQIAMVPIDDGIRTKGDVPRLRIHRVDASTRAAIALRDGDTVAPGAILQATLLAGPSLWIAIVSIDASGQVTRHLPEQGDSSILIEGTIQAPHAFQLDDAPGFERFVLVESGRPFALGDIESALRRGGRSNAVAVRPWMSCQSLLVVKPEIKP